MGPCVRRDDPLRACAKTTIASTRGPIQSYAIPLPIGGDAVPGERAWEMISPPSRRPDWSGRIRTSPKSSLLICPSGGLLTGVSSPFCKNILVFTYPKSHLQLFASHPTRGAYHDRHGRGVGCGGRGSVLRAMGWQGGFFESVSDHRASGREMLLRTAKLCGPDAPTLASSSRSCVGPTGLRQNYIR